jgi:hypothetical protein
MNGVFGDLRLKLLGQRDVFDVALARVVAARERAAAEGTCLGAMFFAAVDALGRRAPSCPAVRPGFILRFDAGGFR